MRHAFSLVLLVLLLSGCSSAEIDRHNRMIDDWDRHVALYNTDAIEMNGVMGKYNLVSISLDERIDVVNEYIRLFNVRSNHLNDFYAFIVANEDDLASAGADTFAWKVAIRDTGASLNNNIGAMKSDVERLVAAENELRRTATRQMSDNQYDSLYDALMLMAAFV